MILFDGATLIDPEGGTARPGALLTDGDTIRAVIPEGSGAIADLRRREDVAAIDCTGLTLAPGIVDLGVKVSEPGERHKESFRTAGRAAARGGITTMVTRPDTDPAIDTPEVLEFVARRASADAMVRVVPMAALTRDRAGREMVEIGLLRDAGAAAFTDCDRVVTDSRVFARCLGYARALDALVIAHPQDPGLSRGTCATSGRFASLRGLPSVSPMAERMALDRDMALVEMTEARYHADQITSSRSLPALERARRNGLDVTAGIGIHHLTLNEFDIGDYRTFFKLKPPLRSEDDRQAMVEAVAGGLIDVVCSMHTPQDEESKRLPFEEAASGAVGLETLLPAALRLVHAGAMDLPVLWRALSLNPARRLGLPGGRLAEGAPADLILFDPDAPFVMDRATLASKSKNTPFDGARMQGRVVGTWVGGVRVHG
ncbi:dihydroorotase, multifunctional complex type [Oceaniovalibus guishaninsula JLT2003]|uniref:Dihydroorotase, multifunctional complex type n=1 Tax=Oceaniovalibus guishaninsula JLT2003 TaxID=1231392 RepID=K2H7X4_9RHOB|nr:dihydroorotase [Oceaniovalibus guishaninsula]EKE43723.1 dihydroorotase, multifunctional complex type [Oceaniovalibus guishaninsula JLT2003]